MQDFCAGDGTFLPAGTVLKDPAIPSMVARQLIDQIGATSVDLQDGFTNEWYTTQDRNPFEPVLNATGDEYDVDPRWRLKTPKFGQDLPGVEIPIDPFLSPPLKHGQLKYTRGEETQTVLNLLDWKNPVSPLSISAGFAHESGTVSGNGLNKNKNFGIAFYIKGDKKPVELYSTELVMDYEEVEIHDAGVVVNGGIADDYLLGQGGNIFNGGADTDFFFVSYGVGNNWREIDLSRINDFEAGVDSIGLIGLGMNEALFDSHVEPAVWL